MVSNPREIQKIIEFWKKDLEDITEKTSQIDKKTKENLTQQLKLEHTLQNHKDALVKVCRMHNELDETLNLVIDEQNAAANQLDMLEKEIMHSKGLANDAIVESIEEIYAKAENVKNFTKEVEENVNGFIVKTQEVPSLKKFSFVECLETVQFLEANMVISI